VTLVVFQISSFVELVILEHVDWLEKGLNMSCDGYLQRKPLNVITLMHNQANNINRR
jgi:hypothetical protein